MSRAKNQQKSNIPWAGFFKTLSKDQARKDQARKVKALFEGMRPDPRLNAQKDRVAWDMFGPNGTDK